MMIHKFRLQIFEIIKNFLKKMITIASKESI